MRYRVNTLHFMAYRVSARYNYKGIPKYIKRYYEASHTELFTYYIMKYYKPSGKLSLHNVLTNIWKDVGILDYYFHSNDEDIANIIFAYFEVDDIIEIFKILGNVPLFQYLILPKFAYQKFLSKTENCNLDIKTSLKTRLLCALSCGEEDIAKSILFDEMTSNNVALADFSDPTYANFGNDLKYLLGTALNGGCCSLLDFIIGQDKVVMMDDYRCSLVNNNIAYYTINLNNILINDMAKSFFYLMNKLSFNIRIDNDIYNNIQLPESFIKYDENYNKNNYIIGNHLLNKIINYDAIEIFKQYVEIYKVSDDKVILYALDNPKPKIISYVRNKYYWSKDEEGRKYFNKIIFENKYWKVSRRLNISNPYDWNGENIYNINNIENIIKTRELIIYYEFENEIEQRFDLCFVNFIANSICYGADFDLISTVINIIETIVFYDQYDGILLFLLEKLKHSIEKYIIRMNKLANSTNKNNDIELYRGNVSLESLFEYNIKNIYMVLIGKSINIFHIFYMSATDIAQCEKNLRYAKLLNENLIYKLCDKKEQKHILKLFESYENRIDWFR